MKTRVGTLAVLFAPCCLGAAIEAPEILQKNKDSVVWLQVSGTDAHGVPRESQGTGTIVSKEGHVLTAKHLFQDAQGNDLFDSFNVSGSVGSNAGDRKTLIRLRVDADADLAVLKFEGNRTDYMVVRELCMAPSVTDGGDVVTIGFPKGSDRSVLRGLISNLASGRLWQTSLQVSYGYSGAPVFETTKGRVVGFVAGGTEGVDGRNFMTPIYEASGLLRYLPEPPATCPGPSGAELLEHFLKSGEKGVCPKEIMEDDAWTRCEIQRANAPRLAVVARVSAVDQVGIVPLPNGEQAEEFIVSYQGMPSVLIQMSRSKAGKIEAVLVKGIASGRIIDPNTGQEIQRPR